MLEPEANDFLQSVEREIRLYVSYAEANVVRTKVAQVLRDRATVSRLKSIAGGWAFSIERRTADSGDGAAVGAKHDSTMTDST